MAEVGDDLVDAFFHPMEVFKGRVATDHLVGEYSRKPRIVRGVYQLRLAYRQQQTFGGRRIGAAILFAQLEILLQREFFLLCGFEAVFEVAKNTHDVVTSLDTWSRRRINQSMLADIGRRQWLFSPQNTLKRYR